ANAGNHAADQYRQGIGVRRVEIDADMLEALEHGDQGHEEPGQEDVARDIAARRLEWIRAIENKSLDAGEQQPGDEAGHQGADDPAHDDLANLVPVNGGKADADGGEADHRTD